MTDLPHLHLIRGVRGAPRRKRPGFGANPPRDIRGHGGHLESQLDAIARARTRRSVPGVDPALILRVKTSSIIDEKTWGNSGFTVLAVDRDKSLIPFFSDDELPAF